MCSVSNDQASLEGDSAWGVGVMEIVQEGGFFSLGLLGQRTGGWELSYVYIAARLPLGACK